jgi:phage shock protein E
MLSGSRSVDPSEFAAAIAETNRLTINVHVPYEGEIAGTDLSIPFDKIAEQAATLPAERNTPLAIYCRTGRMSVIAASKLSDLGYTNVLELQGGMQAWEASGRSLELR